MSTDIPSGTLYVPSMISDVRLINAYSFAATKHSDQRRKDKKKTPYINHPIHVAQILMEAGVTDVNIIIAAILHDTIEDTETTGEEIERLFGSEVRSYVEEVTDDKSLSTVERKKTQISHSLDDYLSFGAKLIKLADKYSNLSTIVENPPEKWSPEIVRGYIDWSFEIIWNFMHGIDNSHFEFLFNELSAKIKQNNLKKYFDLLEERDEQVRKENKSKKNEEEKTCIINRCNESGNFTLSKD
jgi:guanosine-3',5'-bis(diphosphate) 3'-pyrophosphohydrolase